MGRHSRGGQAVAWTDRTGVAGPVAAAASVLSRLIGAGASSRWNGVSRPPVSYVRSIIEVEAEIDFVPEPTSGTLACSHAIHHVTRERRPGRAVGAAWRENSPHRRRQATDKGLRRARHIAEMLAERDITTVSGLALGVDAAAHRAALDAGGRTVAVVANGVDQCYPKANLQLQEEIAQRGLVLSAYLPGTRPQKWQFLERNAVMSGYAAATIVVEAGERSGTR